MDVIDAIILGVVQGLTEFLPVSSSGHLILTHHLLNSHVDNLSFDVALHTGTLLSLGVLYLNEWRRHNYRVVSLKDPQLRQLAILVAVATVPTAIIGLSFRHAVERISEGTQYLASGFFLNAILLLFTQWRIQQKRNRTGTLTNTKAFYIGVAQGVAILPAVSRSGTTITAALLMGVNRFQAVMFSFLISVPAIAGACLLEVPKINWRNTPIDLVSAGVFSSFVSGLIGILAVRRLVNNGKLHYLAIYLIFVTLWTFWQFGEI